MIRIQRKTLHPFGFDGKRQLAIRGPGTLPGQSFNCGYLKADLERSSGKTLFKKPGVRILWLTITCDRQVFVSPRLLRLLLSPHLGGHLPPYVCLRTSEHERRMGQWSCSGPSAVQFDPISRITQPPNANDYEMHAACQTQHGKKLLYASRCRTSEQLCTCSHQIKA